eukprot:g122.t1
MAQAACYFEEEEEEAGGQQSDRIHQAGPLAAVVHVAPSGPVSDRGPAAAVVVPAGNYVVVVVVVAAAGSDDVDHFDVAALLVVVHVDAMFHEDELRLLRLAAPAGSLPDIGLCALFGVGAFVMRGAGCTINDMWDRRFDAQVARTLNRPLASGRISMFNALLFLGAQLSCGLAVLMQLNTYSIVLGAASLGLVVTYPLAKRFTDFPQAVLGLTFNWGALLGWSAVHGSCEWSIVLPLYASGVAWTLVYDTLYAHQDKIDDRRLGLRSTALFFGESRSALYGFAGVSTTALLVCGASAGLSWPFYCGAVGAGMHMVWQIYSADFDDRKNLNQRFVSNNYVGAMIMSGIFIDAIL